MLLYLLYCSCVEKYCVLSNLLFEIENFANLRICSKTVLISAFGWFIGIVDGCYTLTEPLASSIDCSFEVTASGLCEAEVKRPSIGNSLVHVCCYTSPCWRLCLFPSCSFSLTNEARPH